MSDMPVTPITPAQIDEVGKGASFGPGSHPSDQAASHLGGDAVSIPSRGRFVNGVEDLPSEDDMIERGMIALPDSVRYDIEREARSLVNVFVPDAPPALLQGIEAALFRAEKRRIADLKRERASAFAAANPSGGWRAIESMPKNGMFIVTNTIGEVCPIQVRDGQGIVSNHPGFADWTWGQPATLWQPLPAPPSASCDGSAEGGETGTGSTEGNSAVGEAETPEATPSLPPSPSPRKGQEENPCPMTVEEAVSVKAPAAFSGDYLRRDLELEGAQSLIDSLNDGLPDDAHISAEQWVLAYRRTSSGWEGSVRKAFLARAAAIELALSTIRASEEDR